MKRIESEMITKEFILNNVVWSLQPKDEVDKVGTAFTVPTEHDDIVYNLRVMFSLEADAVQSFKVTEKLLEAKGITRVELFARATENTLADVKIFSLAEKLGIHTEFSAGMQTVLIVTNSNNLYGASAIEFDKVKAECLDRLGTDKAVVIPSSKHEVLVLAYDEEETSYIKQMVEDVNSEVVEERDFLSNNPWIISR